MSRSLWKNNWDIIFPIRILLSGQCSLWIRPDAVMNTVEGSPSSLYFPHSRPLSTFTTEVHPPWQPHQGSTMTNTRWSWHTLGIHIIRAPCCALPSSLDGVFSAELKATEDGIELASLLLNSQQKLSTRCQSWCFATLSADNLSQQ